MAGSSGAPASEGRPETPRTPRLGISGYWKLFNEGYEELVKFIIRPPRAEYDIEELGPARFKYGGVDFVREDVQFPNARNLQIVGSLWRPAARTGPLPCVVYLHGNASCRAEAHNISAPVLASGAMLFAIDFAGCGHSEGEYISLGWFERDDVATALTWLREHADAGAIALWGRSMGAASAVMHAGRDPSLAGLVLDSAYASLEQVALELVADAPKQIEGMPNVPGFLVRTALGIVAKSIKGRANFDLYKVKPIDHAGTCFVPALFATATEDVLVKAHHSQQIIESYAGDHNSVSFSGDHNDLRPGWLNDSASIFLKHVLMLSEESALDVPCDELGRPRPLLHAIRMGQSRGVSDMFGSGRAQQQRASEAEMQRAAIAATEEEMLLRAIEESLRTAQPAQAAPPENPRATLSETPPATVAAPGAAPSAAPPATAARGAAGGGAAGAAEAEAEDAQLLQAIKLSLVAGGGQAAARRVD